MPKLRSRLSASALQLRDQCARRFALQYQSGWRWPVAEKLSATNQQALGAAFHRLVLRQRLGILLGELTGELAELWRCFLASPYASGNGTAEQALHFVLKGIPFVVRFDELRRQGNSWIILDWKIGNRSADELAASWQTRLYRYALAEAGGSLLNQGQPIPPEAIELIYWLVRPGRAVHLTYDTATFLTDRELLSQVAQEAQILPDDLPYP
ncbi:MAG: PD-(D/E)XK nuclease family protein, partial [Cyanobacteria bacterium NC_groundwater_1444_Ag_S-0.65um_54_12]|nr:PD-(D/E)XK nuclease family protein [Cyanobacteria bacterium NC_groundwater_1444_Ag_S-0.65um_54_12]